MGKITMTVPLFFGCFFIAFTPAIFSFLFWVCSHPSRVIIFIASAIFWSLSALVSGGWWLLFPQLQDVYFWTLISSVTWQHLFRFLLVRFIHRLRRGFSNIRESFWLDSGIEPFPIDPSSPSFDQIINGVFKFPPYWIEQMKSDFQKHLVAVKDEQSSESLLPSKIAQKLPSLSISQQEALSSSLGLATMYILILYGSQLPHALGPGSYFSPSCPNLPVFFVSAISFLFIWFFQVSLTLAMFHISINIREPVRKRQLYSLVYFVHLCTALLTLINVPPGNCSIFLPVFALYSILGLYVFFKTLFRQVPIRNSSLTR